MRRFALTLAAIIVFCAALVVSLAPRTINAQESVPCDTGDVMAAAGALKTTGDTETDLLTLVPIAKTISAISTACRPSATANPTELSQSDFATQLEQAVQVNQTKRAAGVTTPSATANPTELSQSDFATQLEQAVQVNQTKRAAGVTATGVTIRPAAVRTAAPVVAATRVPVVVNTAAPANDGPLAKCKDGSLWYGAQHRGACSRHGGVAEWYK